MPDTINNLIAVGRIIGTHGIRGQLKLYSYSGNLYSLQNVDLITVRLPDGILKNFGLKKAVSHGDKFLLTLSEINSIEQAEELAGSELCLYREQLPQPDEDEYYWCDLLGLSVLTDDGSVLGTIADILETGANDVYLVRGEGREYLIPAVASVIRRVDLDSGTMIVTPLEGLLGL